MGKGVKEEPGRSDAMLGDGACSQLVCVQYVCGVVFSILLVRVYVRHYSSFFREIFAGANTLPLLL